MAKQLDNENESSHDDDDQNSVVFEGVSASDDDWKETDVSNDDEAVSGADHALTLVNGRLRLPGKHEISLDSKRFRGIVKRTLPHEAPELLRVLQVRQEKSSRLERIAFVLGIALIGYCVWFFWPTFPPLDDTTYSYDIATLTSGNVDKKYNALLARANQLMREKRYKECGDSLQNDVNEVINTKKEFLPNRRLVAMYLSCRQKHDVQDPDGTVFPQLIELCRKAQKYDSLPEWQLYELYFTWAPYTYRNAYLRYEGLMKQFQPSEGNMKAKAKHKALLAELERLEKMSEAIRARMVNRQENDFLTLDKLICQILVARWIVEGYSSYPDDFEDAGVSYREEAYKLAKQYNNNLEFLKLRRAIAGKVLNNDAAWTFNFYYFDGHKHYKKEYLQKTIEEIDNRIAASGKRAE